MHEQTCAMCPRIYSCGFFFAYRPTDTDMVLNLYDNPDTDSVLWSLKMHGQVATEIRSCDYIDDDCSMLMSSPVWLLLLFSVTVLRHKLRHKFSS